MMRTLIIVFLLLAMPAGAQQSGKVVTLEQALETAKANQPQLRQAHAVTSAAQARVGGAFAPLLPQVNGTVSYQRSTANFAARPGSMPSQITSSGSKNTFDTYNYFNAGLNVNQLVYDFGQTWNKWSAAKATATAQEKTEQATVVQVAFTVRSIYFEARAGKAMVGVAKETLSNQERHLGQIQGFVEIGTRPEIDLAQVRTDRANARVQLINAENDYETSRARLNQAMGVETSTEYEVTDESFPAVDVEDLGIDDLIQEALAARPEVAALSGQLRAQELTLDSVKGGYWPSLGFSSGLSDAGQALNNMAWNWSAALTLSWPLFQGNLTRSQVEETHSNIENMKAQIDALRQQIRLEAEQARLAVRAAKAAIGAAEEAVFNAKERLKLAEGRYETGVGNAIELGDAQLALSNAEAQKVQADYNLASARALLLKALGRT